MAYERQEFIDEVRDASGNITQEGTLLRAEMLMHIEDGIVALEDALDSALGKADLEDYEPLGQTPQYLQYPDAVYNVVVVTDGEAKISATSDTVAELADGIDVTFAKCQETRAGGVYTLAATAQTQWFSCRKTVKIPGLTPGERYELMFDAAGLQQPNNDVSGPGPYGYISVLDGSGVEVVSGFLETVSAIQRFAFAAPADVVTVNIYPTHSGIATAPGVMMRYKDLWINKATAKNPRTQIYRKEVTTAERLELRDVPGGVTIEAVPAANVYAQPVDGGKPGGPLAGKICVCFGDSITGNYAAPYDYPTVISNITGMATVNGGFGGCRMAQHPSSAYDAFSMHSLADSVASGDWSVQDAAVGSVESAHAADHLAALKSVTWPDVDYITIFYGTNDFAGGVALEDADNPMSTETYKGALRHSVDAILSAWPKIRIVVVTPMFRVWRDGDAVTDSDAYTILDRRLPDFAAAAAEVAREYKLPVIDLYNTLGINRVNWGAFSGDGTHPNDDGINRLGETLAARLISL